MIDPDSIMIQKAQLPSTIDIKSIPEFDTITYNLEDEKDFDHYIKDIEKDVKNIDGVEDVNVDLTTATLRVYVDISDSAVETDAVSIANQTYDKVVNVLSPSIYFSQHDNMKMYDLEIHVYNLDKDRENENFVYVIKLKNSNMDESTIQTVSKAKDEALAQQLRDDVEAKNNPQQDDEGDITVGSGETEDTPSETNDDSQEEE